MGQIESFHLPGPAGRLECFLKTPPDAPAGCPVAVVCHPHPLFGGTMHNKVVHVVAEAIGRTGMPVARFNFRGVGASAGRHDAGKGEQDDLKAVLDHLSERFPRGPLLVAGYSFGAYVALKVGCADPRVPALIAIGVPLTLVDFSFLRQCMKPLSFIQGEQDLFGSIGMVMTLAATVPGGARVMVVREAAHGFTGHLDELAGRVAEAIPGDLTTLAEARPAGVPGV